MNLDISRIPKPSAIRRSCIDKRRHYWSGYYHGLQVNGVCARCSQLGRIPPVEVFPPATPKRSELKWLSRDRQTYWKAFHSARRSGNCFECIREPRPSDGSDFNIFHNKHLGLGMFEALEIKKRIESEYHDSKPERHPLINFKTFSALFPDQSTAEIVERWRRHIATCPYY